MSIYMLMCMLMLMCVYVYVYVCASEEASSAKGIHFTLYLTVNGDVPVVDRPTWQCGSCAVKRHFCGCGPSGSLLVPPWDWDPNTAGDAWQAE